jgi:hypothetical protein
VGDSARSAVGKWPMLRIANLSLTSALGDNSVNFSCCPHCGIDIGNCGERNHDRTHFAMLNDDKLAITLNQLTF